MDFSGPRKSDIARGAAEGNITFPRARKIHIARGIGPYLLYYTTNKNFPHAVGQNGSYEKSKTPPSMQRSDDVSVPV